MEDTLRSIRQAARDAEEAGPQHARGPTDAEKDDAEGADYCSEVETIRDAEEATSSPRLDRGEGWGGPGAEQERRWTCRRFSNTAWGHIGEWCPGWARDQCGRSERGDRLRVPDASRRWCGRCNHNDRGTGALVHIGHPIPGDPGYDGPAQGGDRCTMCQMDEDGRRHTSLETALDEAAEAPEARSGGADNHTDGTTRGNTMGRHASRKPGAHERDTALAVGYRAGGGRGGHVR